MCGFALYLNPEFPVMYFKPKQTQLEGVTKTGQSAKSLFQVITHSHNKEWKQEPDIKIS